MVKDMTRLTVEIVNTLDREKETLKRMDEKEWVASDRYITQGWIEALEYVLERIEVMTE